MSGRSILAPASVAGDLEKGDGMSLRKRGGIWWIDARAPKGSEYAELLGLPTKP